MTFVCSAKWTQTGMEVELTSTCLLLTLLFPLTFSPPFLSTVSCLQVYETPFFVAVDHAKKKVVISIRGTLSPKVNFVFLILF